jgi:Na+/phosphate symporter
MVAESTAVAVLQKKIADFAIKLSRGYVSQASSEIIPDILRTNQYFTVAADLAVSADRIQADLAVPADAGLAAEIHEMRDLAEQIIRYADPARRDFDSELLKSLVRRFEESYQELKRMLLSAGSAGKIEIEQMSRYLDLFSTLEGMVKQVAKGGQYLFSMWKARDLQTWLEAEQAEE